MTAYEDHAGDDRLDAAYDFAWSGFRQKEFRALEIFGTATAYLDANSEETGDDEPTQAIVDGEKMITEASVVTYMPVDISVASGGLKLAVELAQLRTITTSTPPDGTPRMEVTVQNRAAVLDVSVEPPIPTGEEYVRPAVTLEMSDDGEDIIGMHMATPDRPPTYAALLEACADQRRYTDLLALVGTARAARGEISGQV